MDNRRDHEKGQGADRRQDARLDASAIPQLSARLSRGPEVRLIDVSRRGALIETGICLRPGRKIDLCFVTADAEITLTGYVVRSSVSSVSGSQLRYQTGVSFSEDHSLSRVIEEHLEAADEQVTAGDPNDPAELAPLTLVAAVQSSTTEFRRLLTVNDW